MRFSGLEAGGAEYSGGVGPAGCRTSALLALTLVTALTSLSALTACDAPAAERFSVQVDGDRFFVRERRGWFSVMLPCKPTFDQADFGSDKIRMQVASCTADGEAFSITFGRFRLPKGASLSMDQIYERAARGVTAQGGRVIAGGRLKMEEVNLAGRPARYLSYQNVDGNAASAHIWILWAEEQQAIYQIMQVGSRVPTEGLRIARSMLVPSP